MKLTKSDYDTAYDAIENIYTNGEYDDEGRDVLRSAMDWLEMQSEGMSDE